MPKRVLTPPSPGDPYSELVEAGGLLFVAGQIGLPRDRRATRSRPPSTPSCSAGSRG